ncbi:hypothetical protein B296_00001700 [Ensete ventricosum]|uniref:Uncharacterized protein n=1 Tax=Ensete ventricosum TaxID=4639 RepID=A0A426ZW63_ENSVE|nr:hypothetical protein B296_00001700 [Ensete ventricosum]
MFMDYRIKQLQEELDALKSNGGPEAITKAEECASELQEELEKTKRERGEELLRREASEKELHKDRSHLSHAQRLLKEARVRARKMDDELLQTMKALESARAELPRQSVVQYKESLGFKEGLKRMDRVTYEYGYRVALARFHARHPDTKVEEDPFTIHPEDDLVPMERQQAFDDSVFNLALQVAAFLSVMSVFPVKATLPSFVTSDFVIGLASGLGKSRGLRRPEAVAALPRAGPPGSRLLMTPFAGVPPREPIGESSNARAGASTTLWFTPYPLVLGLGWSFYSECCRSFVPGNLTVLMAYHTVVPFHHVRRSCEGNKGEVDRGLDLRILGALEVNQRRDLICLSLKGFCTIDQCREGEFTTRPL